MHNIILLQLSENEYNNKLRCASVFLTLMFFIFCIYEHFKNFEPEYLIDALIFWALFIILFIYLFYYFSKFSSLLLPNYRLIEINLSLV